MAVMTADTSEIELDAEVDDTAELCCDMDLGAPGVVLEHFDEPLSLLSPLPSFVTGTVVNFSLGVVVIGGVT